MVLWPIGLATNGHKKSAQRGDSPGNPAAVWWAAENTPVDWLYTPSWLMRSDGGTCAARSLHDDLGDFKPFQKSHGGQNLPHLMFDICHRPWSVIATGQMRPRAGRCVQSRIQRNKSRHETNTDNNNLQILPTTPTFRLDFGYHTFFARQCETGCGCSLL